MKKEYLFIYSLIAFLFLVEFVQVISLLPPVCEGFDKNGIGPNVIHLTEILLDNTSSTTKIELINNIKFTSSESGNFKPILEAKVKKPNGKFTDLDSDTKIEYIKQKIIKTYILDCNYNSFSQIQDIKYLKSTNPDIQKILNNSKDDPSHKILDIANFLDNSTNHFI
jgi:hypothetical protein